MSKQIFEKDGVTVTRYSRGQNKGFGYQVTWGVDKWVQFDNVFDANALKHLLLHNAIARS